MHMFGGGTRFEWHNALVMCMSHTHYPPVNHCDYGDHSKLYIDAPLITGLTDWQRLTVFLATWIIEISLPLL